MTDENHVKCPHCGEITHIGGLIGEHTNDCPRCGKRALYPPNKCPKCNSDDWDWANIGFTDVVLCTDCWHLYPSTGDRWPFPTIEKPLKPLTPKEVKQYNKQQVQSLGDSPM